jgi:hypothetical protein
MTFKIEKTDYYVKLVSCEGCRLSGVDKGIIYRISKEYDNLFSFPVRYEYDPSHSGRYRWNIPFKLCNNSNNIPTVKDEYKSETLRGDGLVFEVYHFNELMVFNSKIEKDIGNNEEE